MIIDYYTSAICFNYVFYSHLPMRILLIERITLRSSMRLLLFFMRNCIQQSFFQGNNAGVCHRIFHPLFHKTIVPFFLFSFFFFSFFFYITFIFPYFDRVLYAIVWTRGTQSHIFIFVFILPLMANKGAASRFPMKETSCSFLRH